MEKELIPASAMNPASSASPKSKFSEERVNSIFNVVNVGYQTDFLKGNGIYCVPEQGAKIDPRAITNFGWKLRGFSDGSQITTGMMVVRKGKEILPAGPSEVSTPFIVGWGQEHQETLATGCISIYREPSNTMFVTNVIHKLSELKVDDELTVLSGYLIPTRFVTKELYELSTGLTVADDAEAQAACKPYFKVVNDHQETVLTLAIFNVVGEVRRQKRLVLIESIKY